MIKTEVQHLDQNARVTLFELDASSLGEGVLRWTAAESDDPIVFNGYTYQQVAIEAEGFEWNGAGTLPRPTLTMSSMNLALVSLVLSANDLVGLPVKRVRVYARNLDNGSDPDPLAFLPIDYYRVERKAEMKSRSFLQFELSVELDQQSRMIPHRQIIRETCSHRYRWWDGAQYRYEGVTCPYAGGGEWNKQGNPVPPGQGNDECGKRLSDCRLRFGQHGVLPTRAFPGVGKY